MPRPSLVRVAVALLVTSLFVTVVVNAPANAAVSALDDGPLTLTLSPSTGITATTPVTVTVTSPGPWQVSLCDSAIGTSFTPLNLLDNCLPSAGYLPGATGTVVFDQPVFQTISDGRTVDCTASPTSCVVVVYPGDQQFPLGPFASAPISFGVVPLAAQPTTSLKNSQIIDVYQTGTPGSVQQLAQCALPVGTTLATSTCGTPNEVTIPTDGQPAHHSFQVVDLLETGSGDVDCAVMSCGLATFDSSGTAIASLPLQIDRTPRLSLSPTTGLLDGDTLTLAATRLLPGQTATVEQCIEIQSVRHCELDPDQQFTAGADGAVSTTVHAAQRFSPTSGFFGYCRLSDCSYGFHLSGADVQPDPLPYTLAAGSVSATPSTGLADGQNVTLEGTGLMPTYVGRSFGPFTSGDWVTVECAASIGTAPTLYQAFQDCGFPGNASMVDVPGSTMTTTVAPQASLTAVLGATTDCTAAPGACVIGLVRFEQDGTMSTHLAPLTFA